MVTSAGAAVAAVLTDTDTAAAAMSTAAMNALALAVFPLKEFMILTIPMIEQGRRQGVETPSAGDGESACGSGSMDGTTGVRHAPCPVVVARQE
jgi:hypothetical protein